MIITTIRGEKIDLGNKPIYSLAKPYSKGSYNKFDDEQQYIRISEGCPNGCVYCAETWENGSKPIYYEVPELVRNKVKILDMNLMYKPNCVDIINNLGQRKANNKVIKFNLQCGIDWRYMTQEKASALKKNRFEDIRWAWDYAYADVYKMWDCLKYLVQAGYDPKNIQVFMICNWKVPYYENLEKLYTLMQWGVQISDCWFDNQLPPNIEPVDWTKEEIKEFRRLMRDHNIRIRANGIQTERIKKQDKSQNVLTQEIGE